MIDPYFWLTAVSMVGFPIVGFCMMFWFALKVVRENTKAIKDLDMTVKLLLNK